MVNFVMQENRSGHTQIEHCPEGSQAIFHSIALKVQERQDLSVRESHILRKSYRRFRCAFDRVLTDIESNEARVLAIASTLRALERNELAADEFMAQTCYAYRLLRGFESSGSQLRTEIAYRLALATLFYRSQSVTSLLHFSPANAEFTYQLLEVDHAFQDYYKWKSQQTAVLRAA